MVEVSQLLVGIGVGGIVVALIGAVVNRRKLSADTAQVLSHTALELVLPLKERIAELESKIDELEVKVSDTLQQLDACQDSNARKDALIAELTRGA